MTETQSPYEVEPGAPTLAQTVADMVAAELAKIRAELSGPPPAPPPPELPEPEEDGRLPVEVRLQPLHAEYLYAKAAQVGETPSRFLETLLRRFRQQDTERPGMHTAPSGPGGQAGTSRR